MSTGIETVRPQYFYIKHATAFNREKNALFASFVLRINYYISRNLSTKKNQPTLRNANREQINSQGMAKQIAR